MVALDCRISEKEWLEQTERDGHFLKPVSAPQAIAEAGPWTPIVQEIVALQDLGDDWDGFGAHAPSRELLESAVALACLLSVKGAPPPDSVVPGPDGDINFEWQDADGGTIHIELDRPLHAQVMVLEPGKPPKFWNLPAD